MENETQYTFYGHEVIGSEMADNILKRLGCLDSASRREVVWLVSNHMKAGILHEMRRHKQAPILRHPAAKKLMLLNVADVKGRIPFCQEELTANAKAFEDFHANDRTLEQLGITGGLLLTCRINKTGELHKPGPAVGEKLRQMTIHLDRNPGLTRTELLAIVGLKETV